MFPIGNKIYLSNTSRNGEISHFPVHITRESSGNSFHCATNLDKERRKRNRRKLDDMMHRIRIGEVYIQRLVKKR